LELLIVKREDTIKTEEDTEQAHKYFVGLAREAGEISEGVRRGIWRA
jgi:hypothetical protein